jgi:hypothetical protein
MSLSTKVLPATDADLTTIGEIIATANLPDTVMQFAFTDWPNLKSIPAFYTARVRGAHSSPETTVVKIVDESTEEILGVVCLGIEASSATEDRDLLKPTDDFVPENMNAEFVSALVEKIHDLFVTLPRKHHRESGSGKSKYYSKFPSYLKYEPGSSGIFRRRLMLLCSRYLCVSVCIRLTDIISASNAGCPPKTPEERIRNKAHSALLSDCRCSWNSNIFEFLSSGS